MGGRLKTKRTRYAFRRPDFDWEGTCRTSTSGRYPFQNGKQGQQHGQACRNDRQQGLRIAGFRGCPKVVIQRDQGASCPYTARLAAYAAAAILRGESCINAANENPKKAKASRCKSPLPADCGYIRLPSAARIRGREAGCCRKYQPAATFKRAKNRRIFFIFQKRPACGCLSDTTMAFGVRPSAIQGRLKGNRFVRYQSPIAAKSSA